MELFLNSPIKPNTLTPSAPASLSHMQIPLLRKESYLLAAGSPLQILLLRRARKRKRSSLFLHYFKRGLLSRPRASPRTRHGELSAGFALARRQPCRRSLKVISGASAAGAAGYGARNREIPRGTMSLPSATREERWTRNASSPGTQVPWLRRFPQNRNKRRLWNEVKPHLHPSPRCPSGRRCGESPLPSTGTRLRSLIFPACSWGFP